MEDVVVEWEAEEQRVVRQEQVVLGVMGVIPLTLLHGLLLVVVEWVQMPQMVVAVYPVGVRLGYRMTL